MAVLRLLPSSGPPIEIEKTSTLGREPGLDVVLPDGSVSRKHARIELRGEAFFVIDLGSANGTFLNGAKVMEAELHGGQFLRFGTLNFQVELPDELPETLRLEAMPAPPLIQRGLGASELIARLDVLVRLSATREALAESQASLESSRTVDGETEMLSTPFFDKQVEKLISFARRILSDVALICVRVEL